MPHSPDYKRTVDQIRAEAHARAEYRRTKSARFFEILRYFRMFKRAPKLDLVESGMIWAITSVAEDRRHFEDCQEYFFAWIDLLYAATLHADLTYSEQELEEIVRLSNERRSELMPQMAGIIKQACNDLAQLSEKHPRRIVAQWLETVRCSQLEFGSSRQLADLVLACFVLCTEYELELQGAPAPGLTASLQKVMDALLALMTSVSAKIKSGRLQIVDGKIVRSEVK